MSEDKAALTARTEHASDYGRWILLRRRPPPFLRPYVSEIQGYAEEGGRPVLRKELPSGIIPLILVFGPGFSLHENGAAEKVRPLDRSFVAGLHDRHALVGSQGQALCMQIDFTPIGARRFLNMPLAPLAGEVADLGAIVGPAADKLEERLGNLQGWPERFAVVERVLSERILAERAPQAPLIEAALDILVSRGGDIRIGSLAARLGCSRKHLAVLFRRELGLPPKTLARVLKFERAAKALQSGRFTALADLAASCGYADQAHLTHDFTRFAGESPLRLLARTLPDGTGVMAGSR